MPFGIDGVFPNLLLLIPRILTGYGLTFVYAPRNFGTPWTLDIIGLESIKVSDVTVEIVRKGEAPIDLMPEVFAWSIGFMEAYGGLLMLFSLNTRLPPFYVFLTMGLVIVFRSWDGTWEALPIFVLFCLGLFLWGLVSEITDWIIYSKKKFNSSIYYG